MFQVVLDEPYDRGSPITNCQYRVNGGNRKNFNPAKSTSPVTFDNLDAGRSYSIRIRAVNAVGPGAASEAVTIVGQKTQEETAIAAAALKPDRPNRPTRLPACPPPDRWRP